MTDNENQLSALQIAALNEIVKLEGNCLTPSRCNDCPLRMQCHPTFYNSEDHGRSRFRDYERVNHAMNLLTMGILFSDEPSKEDTLA